MNSEPGESSSRAKYLTLGSFNFKYFIYIETCLLICLLKVVQLQSKMKWIMDNLEFGWTHMQRMSLLSKLYLWRWCKLGSENLASTWRPKIRRFLDFISILISIHLIIDVSKCHPCNFLEHSSCIAKVTALTIKA